MSNKIYQKNRNDYNNRNKRLFYKTYNGIEDFGSSGKNINNISTEKYITQSNNRYNAVNSYEKVLEDISFIPLQNYVKHIYTGLYYGKEPYEYEIGEYNLPKITGNLVTGNINYVDYQAKNYITNSNDPYYISYMPVSGEKHVLFLDLNLYGFEEDSIENCDIELNAMVLKTGYFYQVPKDPSILNFKINDINPIYLQTDSINDYIKDKRVLKSCDINSSISYNASFNSDAPDLFSDLNSVVSEYRYIKNIVTISPPFITNNKNIALPCLFQHKSANNNLAYDIGEYKFLVFDSLNNFLQTGNYITGTQTGFLYFLTPGTYTTIISGNENDFLYTENSLSGKNQNIGLVSMKIDFITGEKLQEIYIENQDKIWATYALGSRELVFGSGYNTLNLQDPIAFAIDFERSISGTIESPFLFYKEVLGSNIDICQPIISIKSGKAAACSQGFCIICQDAAKRYKAGETYINIPKSYLTPISVYSTLNFVDSENDDFYRVEIDAELTSLCCFCKDNGCSETKTELIINNLNTSKVNDSGDAVFSGLYFIDDVGPRIINQKYNENYYSGQIAVNSFSEGDKILFKQYPFDFEKIYLRLYGVQPSIREYTTEFIYSTGITGPNYFNSKEQLINNINQKLASSGLYSWKPLKYSQTPEFEYGKLLTGIDAGIDEDGNDLINIISLRSGKFGSHDIKLVLQPRLQIYNYLVPKIIRLEVSDDYVNWTGIVTSENRQPINTYIKTPNASFSSIPYENIENTKYTITRTIPTSSEIENKIDEEEDLEDLLKKLQTGNSGAIPPVIGSTVCLPDPTGSGIVCGSGFIDYQLLNFTCKEKPLDGLPKEPTGKNGLPITEKEKEQVNADNSTLTQEIDRFRIGYYDYLS